MCFLCPYVPMWFSDFRTSQINAMKVFIRSAASISPQKTFGQASFLTEAVEYIGNRLTCIEPDYSGIIDTKLIRRMSRIIKMGVAAAAASLQEAKVAMP